MSAALELHGVWKTYDRASSAAVAGVTLAVEKGKVLAVVGPSGCGKTTLLRLVAGFERPDAGQVVLGGRTVAGPGCFVPPERRHIGMVFQEHALLPHLTVAGNIAFGMLGASRPEVRKRVDEMLALVGLEPLRSRYPHELSGGERQRVALARALAGRPIVALLDEPFSSLDADLRRSMREEVRNILKDSGATALFVTHDREEALFMGDQLAVLRLGRLEQQGAPEYVFQRPATRFVAEFLGQADFLPGEAAGDRVRTELGMVRAVSNAAETEVFGPVEVALRPDDVAFAAPSEADRGVFVESPGADRAVLVESPGADEPAVAEAPGTPGAGGDGRGVEAVVVGRQFGGLHSLYELRLPSGLTVHALRGRGPAVPVGAVVRAWVPADRRLPVLPCPGEAVEAGATQGCQQLTRQEAENANARRSDARLRGPATAAGRRLRRGAVPRRGLR